VEAYEVYLFLHVLSAILWVGGMIIAQFFGARAAGSGDPGRRLAFARDMDVAGRIFTFAAMSTLLWGILMVVESPVVEFEQAWIIIGFAGVAAGAGLGMGFLMPKTRQAIAQMEAGDAAAATTMRANVMVSRLLAVILVVVVWAMTFKPGL
jgi:hypothetical protein